MGGRQREFDKQDALDAAMHVFWKMGYLGASLSDLTESMGINKPSLYSTFGNKEELFVQATEHYIENYASPHFESLHQENAPLKTRIFNYLSSVILSQCEGDQPKGCYITLCVSEDASDSLPEKATAIIADVKAFTEDYFTQFFKVEIQKKTLCEQHNPQELSMLIVTFLHGTAAMSRGGYTYLQLEGIIKTFLRCFDH